MIIKACGAGKEHAVKYFFNGRLDFCATSSKPTCNGRIFCPLKADMALGWLLGIINVTLTLIDENRNLIQTGKPAEKNYWKRGSAGSKLFPTCHEFASLFHFTRVKIGFLFLLSNARHAQSFVYNADKKIICILEIVEHQS